MTTENDTTAKRDVPPRIVSHRLQKTTFQSGHGANGAVRPTGTQAQDQVRDQLLLRQVILVDRDIDALRDIAIALREEYEFHISISGNEALALLQDGSIDTIIVGQTLFSGTGIGVLAAARRHAPHTRRVLLANASEASGLNSNSSEAGPFHIMPRPCTPEKLREFLESNEETVDNDVDDKTRPYVSSAPQTSTSTVTPSTSTAREVVKQPAPRVSDSSAKSGAHDSTTVEHVVMETSQSRNGRAYASHRSTSGIGARLPVVVFTDDNDFSQSILAAIQDTHDVRVATQIESVVELAEFNQCALLITDHAVTQVELQRISIAVRAVDPNIVVIAAGALQNSQGLRQLIGTPALHCFLPKPISAQLTKLALESARREYLQRTNPTATLEDVSQYRDFKSTTTLRQNSAPTSASVGAPIVSPRPAAFLPMDLSNTFEDPTDWSKIIRYGGFALLAIAAILAVGYGAYSLRNGWPQHRGSKLELAQRAFDEGHYFEPADASAVYYYKQILANDPNNAAAKEGVQRIVDQLVTRTEQALVADRYDDAALSLEQLRDLQPSQPRIAYLDAQLQKSRRYADGHAANTSKSAIQTLATQTVIDQRRPGTSSANNNDPERKLTTSRWMQTARERMDQRRYVTPTNDSAESYLRQVERLDPTNPAMLQMLREIGTNLINDARRAIETKQLVRARSLLDDAERFDGLASTVTELRKQIESTESIDSRTRLLNLALQRARDNQLIEPEHDSARYYLEQLQQLDDTSTEFAQAQRAVGLRLIDNATRAISQQQYNLAVRLLNESRATGFRGPELADAEQRLRTARNSPAASNSATTVAQTASNRTNPITLPRAIKTVPPQYPATASINGVEGWVDVRFLVNADGTVDNAVAIASDPPGHYAELFEKAATAAVSEYRFETSSDALSSPQTMALRIQFKLKR